MDNKYVVRGKWSYGEPKILAWGKCPYKVYIDNFSAIAENVTIILQGNHRMDWVSQYPFPTANAYWETEHDGELYNQSNGDVFIGSDVWIGYGAIILSGITIGNGAVVGAGAVVTKSVPPYTVVAGNPAKEIRKRFDEETIKTLLETAWWDWPDEKIKENMAWICNPIPKKESQ